MYTTLNDCFYIEFCWYKIKILYHLSLSTFTVPVGLYMEPLIFILLIQLATSSMLFKDTIVLGLLLFRDGDTKIVLAEGFSFTISSITLCSLMLSMFFSFKITKIRFLGDICLIRSLIDESLL